MNSGRSLYTLDPTVPSQLRKTSHLLYSNTSHECKGYREINRDVGTRSRRTSESFSLFNCRTISARLTQHFPRLQPARHVHDLAATLISSLTSFLIPSSTVSLPPHLLPPHYVATSSPSSSHRAHPPTSSIVPLLTSSPRPLSAFLRELGYLVRPITYPTVPKGMERVRVCLHAGNTKDQVVGLAEGVRRWEILQQQNERSSNRIIENRDIRARL